MKTTRRQSVEALGAAGAAVGLRQAAALAQAAQHPGPPSTVTMPPRDFSPNAPPTTYFTDPDVVAVDTLFGKYGIANSAMTRLEALAAKFKYAAPR